MTFEHAHTSIDSTPTQRAHQHRVISQENHWNGMVFRKIQIEIVTKKHHVANVRPSRHHQLDSRAHDVENSLQFPHSRYFGRACVGLGYCMCVCVSVGMQPEPLMVQATMRRQCCWPQTHLSATTAFGHCTVRRSSWATVWPAHSQFAHNTLPFFYLFRSSRIQKRMEVIIQICIAKLRQ